MGSTVSMTFVLIKDLGLDLRLSCVSRKIVRLNLIILGGLVLFVFLNKGLIALWATRVDFFCPQEWL